MRRSRVIALAGAGAAVITVWVTLALLLGPSPQPLAPVPHTTRTGPPAKLTSPFTGEPIGSLGPVIVMKIDNIVQTRPPTGLNRADIVYLLPVEGGLSRIFAVYSSHVPQVIGPVRSAREDDLELLRQFGRPGFGYSGATPHLLPFIARARVVNLYNTPAYFRDPQRVAPHNLYARGKLLLQEAPDASKARDIGFRFGPAPAGGKPTNSFSVSFPAAAFTFRWSDQADGWRVWMDGKLSVDTTGGDQTASTVIIQDTVVRTSRFIEYGKRPPFAQSDGSGTATVLRNGLAYHVRWSRPNADGGTTYTLPNGKRMLFAPGQAWVVLTTRNWRAAGL